MARCCSLPHFFLDKTNAPLCGFSPERLQSKCGKTTTLLKAEVMANDSLRRRLHGVAIKPAGSDNLQRLPASWGAMGDNTLKFSGLNWNIAQADGASLCFELERSISINQFCFGAQCRWVPGLLGSWGR
jgi:hypothetical protein